jgi:hypothetical protein
MDALTAAVSPLYDNLTMEIPVGNEKMTLGNVSIS